MNTLQRILDHFRPSVPKHDPGPRNAKGEWRPTYPSEYAPAPVWPPRSLALLKWFVSWPGFMWPRNLVLLAISALHGISPNRIWHAVSISSGIGWHKSGCATSP